MPANIQFISYLGSLYLVHHCQLFTLREFRSNRSPSQSIDSWYKGKPTVVMTTLLQRSSLLQGVCNQKSVLETDLSHKFGRLPVAIVIIVTTSFTHLD
jgi:hypothetical protein